MGEQAGGRSWRQIRDQLARDELGWVAAVHDFVALIPEGGLTTYGDIACFLGRPGHHRAVARAMASASEVPWWRVVRADGVAPIEGQLARLREEGVAGERRAQLRRCRWHPSDLG